MAVMGLGRVLLIGGEILLQDTETVVLSVWSRYDKQATNSPLSSYPLYQVLLPSFWHYIIQGQGHCTDTTQATCQGHITLSTALSCVCFLFCKTGSPLYIWYYTRLLLLLLLVETYSPWLVLVMVAEWVKAPAVWGDPWPGHGLGWGVRIPLGAWLVCIPL